MSNIREYSMLLRESAEESGSVLCMGLDPVFESLPKELRRMNAPGEHGESVLEEYFFIIFEAMIKRGLRPAAWKPNIGYFHAMDRPREGVYAGSQVLAAVLDMIEEFFPGIPIILDSKRGDIARSSENYAHEAYACWECDAVTVSPYMGSDSVSPFFRPDKGIYVLTRTSNPGGADLQNLEVDGGTCYSRTAELIIQWHVSCQGVGSVVGATNPRELAELARQFAPHDIPLLIPGVGSQGGSAVKVMDLLQECGYDPSLVRINSSSGLTHPWKDREAPKNWLEVLIESFVKLHRETALN